MIFYELRKPLEYCCASSKIEIECDLHLYIFKNLKNFMQCGGGGNEDVKWPHNGIPF